MTSTASSPPPTSFTNAALWLVENMTYAARIDSTGTPLRATDFDQCPWDVPAARSPLCPLVSAISLPTHNPLTWSRVIGQGHSVVAVDAARVAINKDRFHNREDVRLVVGLSKAGSRYPDVPNLTRWAVREASNRP